MSISFFYPLGYLEISQNYRNIEFHLFWFLLTGCPFCRSDIKGIENIVIDPFKKNNELNQSGSSTPSTPASEMMRAPFSGHGSNSVISESSAPMAEMLPPRNPNPKTSEPQVRRQVKLIFPNIFLNLVMSLNFFCKSFLWEGLAYKIYNNNDNIATT